MSLEQQWQRQQLLPVLPGAVDSLSADKLLLVPPRNGDVVAAVPRVVELSIMDDAIRYALQRILLYGVPIAANMVIRDLDYELGGSLQPLNESWPQAYKWAVVLIIVFSIICFAVVGLVLAYIVFERRRETQDKLKRKGHSKSDDDAYSHSEHDAGSLPQGDSYAVEESSDSSYDSFDDEEEGDEWSSSSDEV
ncbi:hypothetical protein LMJF_13_1260 [Leishmania major strain Friedlin]|uniref:Uncharacterized protein n=1 Tax=Leishmania major TaxID=5664 RepID=Q4QG28_LEIMA|nr:hypothetical protein LMJF_13_1260 [Leishmania major strain Friedlin]CAG9571107.1 hypothetical_protein_-_conserved [Leishmania major strain Friedlin]CAJ03057.1 hypothetical protein LMJF_13_1260 [Leishmania major strain Friedlin]|eukprot:XP_001681870.1 hypothetical protein LMJF_13_1260 [Leishmania major strain Friedlin]